MEELKVFTKNENNIEELDAVRTFIQDIEIDLKIEKCLMLTTYKETREVSKGTELLRRMKKNFHQENLGITKAYLMYNNERTNNNKSGRGKQMNYRTKI